MSIIVLPALVRTAVHASQKSARGERLDTGQKLIAFLWSATAALLAACVACVATAVAFFAACAIACVGGWQDDRAFFAIAGLSVAGGLCVAYLCFRTVTGVLK